MITVDTTARAVLVEGVDDKWFIEGLLTGRDLPTLFQIKDKGGYHELKKSLGAEIRTPGRTHLGIVLDCNSDGQSRWQSLRDKLKELAQLPLAPPPDGFVTDIEEPPVRFGIWMMPDNGPAGMLESTLLTFVEPQEHWLLKEADKALSALPEKPPRFRETHRPKAYIHTWLAWRDKPGVALRDVFKNRLIRADNPAGNAFIAWLGAVFEFPTTADLPV